MKTISLQSGSNGNCIYVEANGVRLLFDAGISGIQAERRLAHHGRDIRKVDALIISHEHSDHIRSAGIFHRKYGIPVYLTPKTLSAAGGTASLGPIREVRHFQSGETLDFGPCAVETVPTAHDGVDGVAFVVSSNGHRLGVFTDLGHVWHDLPDVIASLDAVIIESNYDPEMLEHGPYPAFLRRRIKGPGGHLSNLDAAMLLKEAGSRCAWACLAHLSEQNNTPAVALRTYRETLGEKAQVCVASRYEVSDIMEL